MTGQANNLNSGYFCLDIGVHCRGNWKKTISEGAASLFEVKRGRKRTDAFSDPERLCSEIGRLKMELDWLKKKSGLSL